MKNGNNDTGKLPSKGFEYSESEKINYKIIDKLKNSFKKILLKYKNIEPGVKVNPVDAFFAYRLLLGRNPNPGKELSEIIRNQFTYREFLDNLLRSTEFRDNATFLPQEKIWMTETSNFRFWFNTSDHEMGVQMALERYEPENVKLIKSLVKPGMRCVDAGANTGYLTCLLASLVGRSGKVYAFEPMPQNFDLLLKNIEENNFTNVVEPYQLACSDFQNTISGTMISNMYIVGGVSSGEKVTMNSVRLDDFINKPIDIIKIDVEGHEPAAIKGMTSLISDSQPIIISEINEYWLRTCSNSSASEYIKLLYSMGYNVYDFKNKNKLVPVDLSLDILDTMDIVAVPKGQNIIN